MYDRIANPVVICTTIWWNNFGSKPRYPLAKIYDSCNLHNYLVEQFWIKTQVPPCQDVRSDVGLGGGQTH